MRLVCKFSGHKISKRRVWHDGVDYRTPCLRCDTSLIRASNGWREFNSRRDYAIGRALHPQH
tara:strand:+ start:311 stop:496 length:186 start_codon:yes stop_codon:yes gene_type:complete